MHINWWPSSVKREAGSPAPIREKTAVQSSPTRSTLARGLRVRDEFIDGFIFITVAVTLIPGSHGNGGIHRLGRGYTHWGGGVGNQGKNRASDDDPDTQPEPHHQRVEMSLEDRFTGCVLAFIDEVEVFFQRGADRGHGL